MPTDVLDDRAQAPGATLDSGRPGSRCAAPDGGDDPGPGSSGLAGDIRRFGLWVFLGVVTMMFVAFTSAYVVRRAQADWRPLAPPALLWLNTGLLVASSLSLERARRRLRAWDLAAARSAAAVTGLLGAAFVAGQLLAWRGLAAAGVFLDSNPHSSFFYLLTGLHGLHLLGGLIWFGVVLVRLRRSAYAPGADGLGLFATYWHFLGGLWLYVMLLLFAI